MSFDDFQHALDDLRSGALEVRDFSRRVRALAVPPELPPRFGEVLAGLLDRMDSSALFSGESCSFSQEDLLLALQAWIDKARQRLGGAG